MTSRLISAQDFTSSAMDQILARFKPGAKITVLVRRPEHADGSQDFCMTNDDLSAVVAALNIRRAQAGEYRDRVMAEVGNAGDVPTDLTKVLDKIATERGQTPAEVLRDALAQMKAAHHG